MIEFLLGVIGVLLMALIGVIGYFGASLRKAVDEHGKLLGTLSKSVTRISTEIKSLTEWVKSHDTDIEDLKKRVR